MDLLVAPELVPTEEPAQPSLAAGASLLSLRLSASYAGREPVLRALALDLRPGEILGLVGQSGCGKSTLALAILKLLHVKQAKATGSIKLNGRDLMLLNEHSMRALRGKEVALVLQSPMSSLNPALRIGAQLEEHGRFTANPSVRNETRQLRRCSRMSVCPPIAPSCADTHRS